MNDNKNKLPPMERIRRMIELGAPVGDAIRIILGGSIPRWAAKHEIARQTATMSVTGKRVPPDARTVAALVADLQASEPEVRELLGRSAKTAIDHSLATAS